MKFNDTTKEVREPNSGNYFDYGVHRVQLGLFELGGTGEGEKEYIEVTVIDPEDGERTDTVRLWFSTDKAANYSFNTLRQIAVHNAPEDKKDAARDAMDAVEDTAALEALLNEKLIGGECWYTKYQDPQRTYQAQDGSTRRSVNKNIYGYEPKLRPELMPKDQDQITTDNVDKIFPGAEDVTPKNVPDSWA